MLLAIDVGNTQITLAAFSDEGRIADWRIHTDRERTADEYGALLRTLVQPRFDPTRVTGIALVSVVPVLTDTLTQTAHAYFSREPFVVNADSDFGMAIRYTPPGDVGADRLVNAFAARSKYGTPVIVVDCGTATKLEAVDADGDYVGGAIAPGVGISADALFRLAAKLYRVELTAPPKAIGGSTVEAMQSGIVYGFAGQVDGLVNRFRREMGGSTRVVATGGFADLIHSVSETIELVDRTLTLDGLRLLWEKTRNT